MSDIEWMVERLTAIIASGSETEGEKLQRIRTLIFEVSQDLGLNYKL